MGETRQERYTGVLNAALRTVHHSSEGGRSHWMVFRRGREVARDRGYSASAVRTGRGVGLTSGVAEEGVVRGGSVCLELELRWPVQLRGVGLPWEGSGAQVAVWVGYRGKGWGWALLEGKAETEGWSWRDSRPGA